MKNHKEPCIECKEDTREITKVKRNYQITIPQSLRKKINLAVGEYVELDSEDGMIVMRPVKVIHRGSEYFYTKEWQEGEAEADQNIKNGDVIGPFDNIKDALHTLKKAKI